MSMMKRMLSLLLALALLMGNIPAVAFAEETEIPAETEMVAAEETLAPTEAATEPAETVIPTEVVTEPAEETIAPTQPAVPVETAAPTEEATEPAVEETIAPTEAESGKGQIVVTHETIVLDMDLPSNEELFTAYAQQVLYGTQVATFGRLAGDRLNENSRVLYDALVPVIKEIANGNRASVTISVGQTVTDDEGNTYVPDVEATFPGTTNINSYDILRAMMTDMPYELYWSWLDSSRILINSIYRGGIPVFVEITFPVESNYQGTESNTVDTAKTGAASAASANAKAVVAQYAAASDYEKLRGYLDAVCEMVDYDYDAYNSLMAGLPIENFEPWNVIHVFDGDPDTKVVCEGYAKAYEYLCDLTDFEGDIACYTVSGLCPIEREPHAWNVVTIDGYSYLTDPTWSDDGSPQFLLGGGGNVTTGYEFGINYIYSYDGQTIDIWGSGEDSILALAPWDYDPNGLPEVNPNISWTLEDGTLTITGTGNMDNYGMDYYVPWFVDRKKIHTVVIEDGITGIGSGAFEDFFSLTSVTIPDSVTYIGENAFYYCIRLTNIEIPDSVTSINGAFSGCRGLTDIRIPAGVTSIDGAFVGCTGLTNVEIPDSVTSMERAFFGCTNLTSFDVPTGVTSIAGAFGGCLNLTSYEVPNHVTNIDGAFTDCTNLKSVTLHSGVTHIGDWTFSGCTSLTSIEIPDSVTSFGHQPFLNCSSLTSIVLSNNLTEIGGSTFYGCSSLPSITIPASVTYIGSMAFYECTGLKEVIFEGDQPRLSYPLFSDIEVTCYYPANNKTWGSNPGDYGGTIIWVPYYFVVESGTCGENLTWKFENTGTLTISGTGKMTNYSYLTDSPWYARRAEITSVVIENGVTGIGNYAFKDCSSMMSIVIPDSITSIGGVAFSGCSSLTSVVIPQGVTYIGYSAFVGCSSMTSVVIPDGLDIGVGFGESAFSGCTSLRDIVIPEGVTGIFKNTFYNCSSLTNIVIPDSVTTIDRDVFRGSGIISITIPAKVTSIGECTFRDCVNLKEITFKGDTPTIASDTFTSTEAIAYYPAGNSTWTADVMQNYGGTITWKPYGEPQVLPKPVVNAAGNPVTGGGILTWEHDGEADYYEVYRATSKSGKYKLLETVEGTELEVKVSVGKTYYYKVKAICDADASLNSGYSSVVKVTGKCAQPEIAVTPVPASGKPCVKGYEVSGAEEYEIYRSTNATEGFKKIKTTSKSSYTDSKAELGMTYYYKVKAIASKSTYNSVFSEVDSCLTILAQPDAELSINKTTGKPVIEWEKVSGAVSYEILRAESEKGEYTKLANRTELTFEDSNAEPDKDYWYKVNAIAENPALNSIDGDAEMIHATLAQPKVTFGINSITGKPVMTWEEVDGAVEYKIYRSSKSKESYKCIETTTDLNYSDDSVKAGKGYYYKVIAIGENSKSAYSSYKKLTAKCAQPEITAIGADLSSGKPYVDWDKVSGAEKYYVYRATEESGTYKKVKTTTSTSYTDKSAKVGVEYFYKVKAVASKSTYNSIESEVESCLTVLARPVVTAKNDVDTGKVILSWEKVDGAVAYEVYRMGEDGILCQMCTQWELTYTDEGEGTEVDTVYTYTVKAIAENSDLNSAESTAVTISAACEKPSISIALDGKKPMVSWESVEGATKYYVYRSTKKSSGYKKVATVELEDGESYTDSKAKKGTTYYYKIVAVSENAKSAYSNVVKIKSK